MQPTNLPTPGIYRHYKGNNYLLIGTAQHSEDEGFLVIYKTLYGNQDLWARPLAMFTEKIKLDDKWVPRFQLIEAKETNF